MFQSDERKRVSAPDWRLRWKEFYFFGGMMYR